MLRAFEKRPRSRSGSRKKNPLLFGKFGVGFYSAFIVADKVEVATRRAGLDAGEGVRWESDGQGEFTIESETIDQRGTTVTLHLKDAETEFAEDARLDALIRKYSDHIGFPVQLQKQGEEPSTVNSP